MLFDIHDKAQLARLLAVSPQEIDYVLRSPSRYYRPKRIPKRDGSIRELMVPCGKLKLLQRKIRLHILDEFPFLDCVHGGVKRRSVISNAFPHIEKPVVFSVDIKDFFPHVTPQRVSQIFEGLGFSSECAKILMKSTTWNHQLPQGASTSTALANLSLIHADWRLRRLAQIQSFSYTRYVDDLTLSGGWRLLKFRKLVQKIVESEGFAVKPQKTITMLTGQRQLVTRLTVNTKINMPREWRTEVRRQVLGYSLDHKAGVSAASIRGRVNWLRYVNPLIGDNFLKRVLTAGGNGESCALQ